MVHADAMCVPQEKRQPHPANVLYGCVSLCVCRDLSVQNHAEAADLYMVFKDTKKYSVVQAIEESLEKTLLSQLLSLFLCFLK